MNQKAQARQLVVNWHILEACNYGCGFCYARYAKPEKPDEICRCRQTTKKTLQEVAKITALPEFSDYASLRLNFAGGEPMLLWKNGVLARAMMRAKRLGMSLSLITNGSLLYDHIIAQLAPRLQILGVSMDSASHDTNAKIGRCGKKGDQTSPGRVAEIFRLARAANPDIECKLNTVVNAYNHDEDMNDIVDSIAPDRWKLFKMLPIADSAEIREQQRPHKITDAQFYAFVARHKARHHARLRPENNDEMTDSYLMIDPHGRFYQNAKADDDDGYTHIFTDFIHKIGIAQAVKENSFDPESFNKRYVPIKSVT